MLALEDAYEAGPGTLLRFNAGVLAVFSQHRQHGKRPEAGGVLIGRDFPGQGIIVEVATVPCGRDRAGRTWFNRSRANAQEAVDAAWHRSGGEQIYLGEWHTHPEDIPSPSWRDQAMIRNMHEQTQMEINYLVLVIVGRQENWVGIRDKAGLRKLRPQQPQMSIG